MKRKIFAIVFSITLILSTCFTVGATGNEWVFDELNVISSETEDYIKNLNENTFSTYEDKPQFAVIMLKELPENYTMDEYKLDMFNEYGVGTKEENCGMLFVFAIEDREYGFEIGDGFTEGSLLREDLETDFIDSDMRSLLRNEKYDEVVMSITKHIEQLMYDEENGVYLQKEEARAKELEETQKAKEKIKDVLIIVVISITGITLLGILTFFIIDFYLDKRFINNVFKEYYKHISLIKLDEETLRNRFKEKLKSYSRKEIKDKILRELYDIYIDEKRLALDAALIENPNVFDNNPGLYIKKLKDMNSYDNFVSFNVVSIDDIIFYTNKEIEINNNIRNKNHEKIKSFINEHKNLVENEQISLEVLEKKMRQHCKKGIELTSYDVEKIFNEEVKELNFKFHFDRFIDDFTTANELDRDDLNLNAFYNSLKQTDEYANYRFNRRYNYSWMFPLMLAHRENEKRKIREREEQERREEAERKRRREEESRRLHHTNNHFGGGFGGGFSSGGGFSGRW